MHGGSRPGPRDADPFDLARFLKEQHGVYEAVLRELRAGRKTGHWIWYVFPQVAGLGRSWPSRRFAIRSLDEALAYVAHPVLGERLRECARLVLEAADPPERVLGSLDATKVRSSMTLFHLADPGEPVFRAVLDRWYHGEPDPLTGELLERDG